MTDNIYKKTGAKKKRTVIKYFPVDRPKVEGVEELKGQVQGLSKKLAEIEQGVKAPVVKVNLPEVQDVKVTNPTPAEKVEFPEVQKVEVTNPTPPVTLPEVQKVEIQNLPEPVTFPEVQRVALEKPIEIPQIPLGKGDIPGKADPETYVPVRLTDGKKFYSAQRDAYVAAAKSVFPFVDQTGKPKPVQLDANGNLPTAASASITTTSGSPLHVYSVNEPTVRQVFVTNPASATVTTASGSPLDVFMRNLPTVQTVAVQHLPYVQVQPGITTAVSGALSVTTTSGSPLDTRITNFPTVQTVNVQNLPPVTGSVSVSSLTTTSGSPLFVNDVTRPTVQTVQGTVEVASLPALTTVSGSMMDVKNFPTIQTVNVQNMPYVQVQPGVTTAVSGTVTPTTTSGSPVNAQVTNFPTVQTVNVQSIPAVTGSVSVSALTTTSGSPLFVNDVTRPTVQTIQGNVAVTSLPSLTTVSGSVVDVKNFPTVQTVNVQNMPSVAIESLPSVTTASGSQVDVKNFPTVQTVNVNNAPNVQITPGITTAVSGSLNLVTTSGSPMFVYSVNEPTVRQVFVTNPSEATVTTTSGSPLDVTVRNFPDRYTVNQGQDPWQVQVKPGVTTAISGTVAVRNDNASSSLGPANGEASRLAVDEKGAQYARLYDGVTGSLATIRTPSDALQDSSIGLITNSFGFVYNGGTWDKLREVVNGQDTTGTGIMATGILGHYDDVSPGTVTENRFAPIRMSSRRGMYVETTPGVTTAVSGSLSLTTTSGSPMHSFVTNFPTIQTVRTQEPIAVTHAALTELEAAIDTEVQVDIVGALPAGANAIGKLAANSGVDIGDVDVTSIAAGDNNIGNVDIVTVPADPFGANADAAVSAGATGSIQAKLRRLTSDLDAVKTAIETIDNAIAGSEMQVDVVAALPAGDNNIGNVDLASAIPAGNNNIGDVDAIQSGTWTVQPGNTANTTPWLTSPRPATSGGLDTFRSLDVDETEEEVKATAGQVFGWWFANLASSPRYLKFYNATAANVTVGTTTPKLTFPLPANSTNFIAANAFSDLGITFDTAICVAATTGLADNDTGAPAANEVVVNLFYK